MASGSGQVNAGTIQVAGGFKSAAARRSARSRSPARRPWPTRWPGCPCRRRARLRRRESRRQHDETIHAGVYSAIAVSGNARLTMDSGIYVIAGGGFSLGAAPGHRAPAC